MRRRVSLVVFATSVVLGACAGPLPSGSAPAQPTSTAVREPSAAASPADPPATYLAQLDLPALLDRAAAYGSPVEPNGDPNAYVAGLQAKYRGVDKNKVPRRQRQWRGNSD